MATNQDTAQERKETLWGFIIALAIIVVLGGAYAIFGLPGAAMVMVIATPILVAMLVLLSIGK
ncbi:MAG: hypothetical protein ACU0CY_03325 [Maritimibacter harenae]|jgi:hypothetical protein